MKIDKTVKKETLYVAAWVVVFSALMEAVFLIIGKWDASVLLGNLLSAVVSILNFLGLGITVQISVNKEEKEAKQTLSTSRTIRTFILFITAVLGAVLSCFNIWSTLITLLFPRVAIALRPAFMKKDSISSSTVSKAFPEEQNTEEDTND